MNISGFAVVAACLVGITQTKVIKHDKVSPFPSALPTSITNLVAIIYQPQIYIHHGCHPYPAVNAKGDTSGGLKPTGASDGGCKGSQHGSQVYGRSTRFNRVQAIMYSWYFPKDSPVTDFGHRHDWEHVIVWIGNFTTNGNKYVSAKILAMTPSAHSGYSIYAPPDADMVNGTSVKVKYQPSLGFINHHLKGTSTPGEYQDLVMWDDLTDAARLALNTTNFGASNVPMNDYNFVSKLTKANPFVDKSSQE